MCSVLLGLARGLLRLALWAIVIGGIGVAVYLLAFREEEPAQAIDYRFSSTVGGGGKPVGCILSDRRPKVRVSRAQTQVVVSGRSAPVYASDCATATADLAVRSLDLSFAGALPVSTVRTGTERTGGGEGGGLRAAGPSRAARGR